MNLITRTYWTAKAVGWDNLPRRVLQMLRLRSGWLAGKLRPENFSDAIYSSELEKIPDWGEIKKRLPVKIPSREALQGVADDNKWKFRVGHVADKARLGEFIYFSHRFARPENFNHDPVNDVHWPTGKHWLGGDTLGGTDIKLLWEPSRFSLAYYLGRHYVRTGDEQAADVFWRLVDEWIEQNPPQLTWNWSCGQEASFRMMAIMFGAVCTLSSPAATQERLDKVVKLAWRTAKHISVNINYARSQGNNHAFSEAAWLITAGAIFNENFEQAKKWLRDGLNIITAEADRQILPDGSYAQHSMSYHRVVMDDLLWVIGVLRACDISVPQELTDKFEAMTRWLAVIADAATGRVPNYGPNDGANILPLSCCDYLDYRPTVQAAWYELYGQNRYAAGCWDEKKLWMFGEQSMHAETGETKSSAAVELPDGGYYIMRGQRSMLFTRCHTYECRPTQNDMLHVDLWYEGRNILRDAGSFSYNASAPWKTFFNSTAAHNTVVVNDADQMIKGPRFLWFNWTRSKLLEWFVSDDGRVGFFSGEHYGYVRFGATHRRSILRIDDCYVILDEVAGRRDGIKTQLNWRLIPDDWQQSFTDGGGLRVACGEIAIEVFSEAGFDVSFCDSGDETSPAGWESLYYSQKSPCPYIKVTGVTEVEQTDFVTFVLSGDKTTAGLLDALNDHSLSPHRQELEKFMDIAKQMYGKDQVK